MLADKMIKLFFNVIINILNLNNANSEYVLQLFFNEEISFFLKSIFIVANAGYLEHINHTGENRLN